MSRSPLSIFSSFLPLASSPVHQVRSLAEGCSVVVPSLQSDALTHGTAFLAVLNFFDSYECPFRPSDGGADNLERFYDDVSRLYGMPKLLDADPDALLDELAILVYLAELMDSLPSLSADAAHTVVAASEAMTGVALDDMTDEGKGGNICVIVELL